MYCSIAVASPPTTLVDVDGDARVDEACHWYKVPPVGTTDAGDSFTLYSIYCMRAKAVLSYAVSGNRRKRFL